MANTGFFGSRRLGLLLKLLVVVGLLCPRSVTAECRCGACRVAEAACPHCQPDTPEAGEVPPDCCARRQPAQAEPQTPTTSPCCCQCEPPEADEGQEPEDEESVPPPGAVGTTTHDDAATGELIKGCRCHHPDQPPSPSALLGQYLPRLTESESVELLAASSLPVILTPVFAAGAVWGPQPTPVAAAPLRALFCTWIE